MAVLNFPDPDAQTPSKTFSPTSTPDATSNGVTYVWTDDSWSIAGVSNGGFLDKDEADSYYVEQSGDNMTGNLTLGTDKITLDATAGSATFAGSDISLNADGSADLASRITIGNFDAGSATSSGSRVAVGSVQAQQENTLINGSPTIVWRGLFQDSETSKIYTDGSADFSGNIITKGIGPDIFGGFNANDRGLKISYSNGTASNTALAVVTLDAQAPTYDGQLKFAVGGTVCQTLNNDGSAGFTANVISGGDPTNGANNGCALKGASGLQATGNAADSYLFRGWQNGSPTITSSIKASGNATFVGNVKIDSYIQTPTIIAGGAEYPSLNGSISLRSETGTQAFYVDKNILQLGGTQPSDPNIQLNNDGSAVFASTLNLETTVASQVTYRKSNVVTGTLCTWNSDVGGTKAEQVRFGCDGSASFSGQVDSGNLSIGNGCRLNGNGTIEIRKDTAFGGAALTVLNGGTGASDAVINLDYDGSAIFKGNITATNVAFNLEPDNDANYTTTTEEYTETESYTGPLGNTLEREVTRTRDVRTYIGPTLDVKDRLQNVLSRIDAIEANEVADDATDSALLQLVASLTARLDEKDAAIASLTATLTALTDRVTTLES